MQLNHRKKGFETKSYLAEYPPTSFNDFSAEGCLQFETRPNEIGVDLI